MFFKQDDLIYETVTTSDSTGKSTSWGLKRVPHEETEVIEEITIVRKRVKKSTDMDGKCFAKI